jgi:predicted MFS family arabinose efflux permease
MTLSEVRPAPAATPPAPVAPPSLVPLLALASGVAVANNYYLQPLLALIGKDLGVGSAQVGLVSAVALFGYALGLLLVVPLGDIVDRRLLVTTVLSGTALSLVVMALAPSVLVLGAAAFGVGLTSVVAQVLVPYAASIADDASRGRVVGFVLSGILVGILSARVVAGLAGAALGWRAVYAGAAGLTLALLLLLLIGLPAEPQRHRRHGRPDIPYAQVLAGVGRLVRSNGQLRVRAFYGACGFAVFSSTWTALAFHLHDQFGIGSTGVALVALLGIGGAVLSPRAGRLADRGRSTVVTGAAYAALLVGTGLLALGSTSLPLLIAGLVVTDLAIQGGHVTNMGIVYRLVPEARSRATTVFMTTLFLGGAVGSVFSALAYSAGGWPAVSAGCAVFAGTALVTWLVRLPVRAPRMLDEPFPEAVA